MIHIPSPPSPAAGPLSIPAPPLPVFVTPFADAPLPPPPDPPVAVGALPLYGFSPAPPPAKNPEGPTAVFHPAGRGAKAGIGATNPGNGCPAPPLEVGG